LILALFVMPLLLALAPISVVILTLSREMQSSARRSRHHLRAVIKAIRAGRPAAETRHDVEEALQLDPDNDAARLLLACLMVEAGQERSALLQLAPLRDHHPDSGEIVFVAAAAYLHMHKPGEALRMLEALDITRDHRCYLAATRMLSDCRRLLGNTKTNELPVWGSPLAEDLREFF
jgi:predicted Zn-dependent protease